MLTQELAEPPRLVVVLDSNAESVEEDEDDDEPVEPLRLHHPANKEPGEATVR